MDKQMNEELRFKYEDDVWICIDPRNLNDPNELPVFKGEIVGWEIKNTQHFDDPIETTVTYSVYWGIDGTVYRAESEIYNTKEDAIKASISSLEAQTTHKEKSYNDALNLLTKARSML